MFLSIYVSHPWPPDIRLSKLQYHIFCHTTHTLLSMLGVRRNFISTCQINIILIIWGLLSAYCLLLSAEAGQMTDNRQQTWQRETTSDGEQSIRDLTRTSARDDWPVVCEQCQYWFSVRADDLCGDIQQQQWQQGREEGGDWGPDIAGRYPTAYDIDFRGILLIFHVEAG